MSSRSEGLGCDCWPCVEVSGKLCITHCLSPPSCKGYLVHRSKVGSIVAGCYTRLLPGYVKDRLIIFIIICSDLKTLTFIFCYPTITNILRVEYTHLRDTKLFSIRSLNLGNAEPVARFLGTGDCPTSQCPVALLTMYRQTPC